MTNSLPIGLMLLPSLGANVSLARKTLMYKIFIICFTFLCYMSYHLSRKPLSVVKSVLHYKNCSSDHSIQDHDNSTTWCDWKPFDGDNYSSLLGELDTAYLFAYAFGMFLSGHIAERMNLRYFLSVGMILCGIFTAAFGFGYFFNIHSLYFYLIIQLIGGLVQASGWPSVVTCMGNWYGKGQRGLIMGIWNSHTSFGNIFGSLIAGAFVNHAWGWSFVVPGIFIGSMGILTFLFLVPEPADVGCDDPNKQAAKYSSEVQQENEQQSLTQSDTEPLLQSGQTLNGFVATVMEDSDEYGTNNDIPRKADKTQKEKPISFFGALKIPGVIEFSFCLFFAKLVSYTFLFWLPKYISAKTDYSAEKSADISTVFDFGGILGGIVAGLISDYTGMRATTCVLALLFTSPVLYFYNLYGSIDLAHSIGLSFLGGFFVNAPYALITTAVSADLGTHDVLQGNAKALSTVTAIIDGTGSIGAAIGPLLAGLIESSGWNNVFYMLIGSVVCALLVSLYIFSQSEFTLIKNRLKEKYGLNIVCDLKHFGTLMNGRYILIVVLLVLVVSLFNMFRFSYT